MKTTRDRAGDGLPVVEKVLAYITHRRRLLLLLHPGDPAAGIQVPGGSLEPDEDPEAAARREAEEETGLTGLRLVGYLGERWFDRRPGGRAEVHHRRFYHLACTAEPPEQWHHAEHTPSDGSPGPIPFEFVWARLPDGVPPLIAGHGDLLPELAASLRTDAGPLARG